MDTKLETPAQVAEKAAWRVAVVQGITLLGFREWVIARTLWPLGDVQKAELAELWS